MTQKNILLKSLRESLTKIWKNKFLFVLLFFLQMAFLAVFSFVSLNYQIKMLENAKAIADYLSQQQLDDVSVASKIAQQKGILGDDPLSISRNYNELRTNFRIYLSYTFILLMAFMSVSWAITSGVASGKKISKAVFLKNIAILLVYLGLVFSFFFSLLNISVTGAAEEASKLFTKYIPFLAFSVVLAYFMFISLSLAQGTGLKNIVQKTLSIGIKKAHYIIAAYAINVSLFAISAFLLYRYIEQNMIVLFLSLIMLIFSFVFGRIFLSKVVEKLG